MTQRLPRFTQSLLYVPKPKRTQAPVSACGKVRHPSEAAALEALARVRAERTATGESDVRAIENAIYLCDRCFGWHLTSGEFHASDLIPERERQPREDWETYAHRLEKRIAEQRAQLLSLHLLGNGAAKNRATRKRIEHLVVALGRMTEMWQSERGHRIALVAQLEAQQPSFLRRLTKRA